jgi:hypothetical protein
MGHLLLRLVDEKQSPREAPRLATRRSQARYCGHQILIQLFLHILGNKVKPFCSPSVMKMVDGERMTAAQFGRCLETVKAVSDKAPAEAVTMGGPPPSNNSAREALVWWVNGTSLCSNGGSGLGASKGMSRQGLYRGAPILWCKDS